MNEKFEAMRTSYDLAFNKAFDAAPSQYESFTMIVGDSAHTTAKLPFFEQFAGMRKWVGARQIKNLEGKMLSMTEDAYEDTVGIKTREIETDNWGMYMSAIQQMAINGKSLWDQLAIKALLKPGKWIDDKAFFAADRKYGKSVICNKTTAKLTVESFKIAYETMMAYAGHTGEPIAVIPDTLIVGPALQFAAKEILENEKVLDSTGTAAVSNPCRGLAKLVVSPRIIGDCANYWFLASCNGPIKPIAIQKSKEVTLVSKNQPTDEGVFMEDQAIFGTSGYGSSAAAFPHLIYGGIVE